MTLLKCLILTLVLSFSVDAALAQTWPLAEMNKVIDQTNFVVNKGCSGTLIDAKRLYVLTANHCVKDQFETVEREKIDDKGVVTKENIKKLRDGTVSQIEFGGSESIRVVTYTVKLIAGDEDVDLALLQIKSGTVPHELAAKLACDMPVRGEPLYIVGNPSGTLYSSVTTGVVSSIQRNYAIVPFDSPDDKKPLMQISGGVVGGNSGGSVYNTSGELIGVPVLANRTNEVIAFAVPLDSIKLFLTANKLGDLFDRCQGE
jgi:S1-C subfamily serine protease